MRRALLSLLASGAIALCPALPAAAQPEGDPSVRVVNFFYTPAERVQVALWIARPDGTYLRTIGLTEAVALRGIGNRPGATQMNSGYRWPYGRREGVLPVWAHARAEAPGAEQFPRVIFQDRTSEGFASRTSNDASRDDYFCLSFNIATTRRDALDAVSCASVFTSDKGRYLTVDDVGGGYAEPFIDGARPMMRTLPLSSLYPPRRDVTRCTAEGCADHPDVDRFAADSLRAMPELVDAVSRATAAGGSEQRIAFNVPEEWPNGDYVAFIEVNTEGDYNSTYNETTLPTPEAPSGTWDYWAVTYGYPYRGQPSVVYRVPFRIEPAGGMFEAAELAGYGALHGEDGRLRDMDSSITDGPGSGAGRLLESGGSRLRIEVLPTNVCGVPDPPEECGNPCSVDNPCSDGFICGPDGECVGMCDIVMPPGAIPEMTLEEHPDEKRSHEHARLTFMVPEAPREIVRYEIRYSTEPITEENFRMAIEAKQATVESMALEVPVGGAPGTPVELEVGQLVPLTTYYFAMRAYDLCNTPGPLITDEVTTTEINFTTVSPCFVATAAHGTPMADEVRVLRRFRDRHLRSNAAGRALVDAYYAVGPSAAEVIAEHDALRALARAALRPFITLAQLLD